MRTIFLGGTALLLAAVWAVASLGGEPTYIPIGPHGGQVRGVPLDHGPDYKLRVIVPSAEVDYKIVLIRPNPNIDYKIRNAYRDRYRMHVVPWTDGRNPIIIDPARPKAPGAFRDWPRLPPEGG